MSDVDHFTAYGWKELSSWNGIVPDAKFYKVGGMLSLGVMQVFICGSILRREPQHGKLVDGKWIKMGEAQTLINCIDEHGQPSSRMNVYENEVVASEEAALQLIQVQKARKIKFKRDQAAKLLAEADALEAGEVELKILDFSVDQMGIPIDHLPPKSLVKSPAD